MGNFTNYSTVTAGNATPTEVATKATWIEGYQQGSFRGVNFYITGAETSGGRRISTHAFPGRDDVYHQDLGRQSRNFRFSAYIVSDNYFQDREALIAALEADGPGKLVHPYRGIFEVVVRNFTQRETTAEGRVARFDIEMAEQKVTELTVVTTNTTAQTAEAKTTLLDSIQAAFAEAYTIAQMPVTAIQDAVGVADQILDVVGSAKKLAATSADFTRELSNAKGKVIQFTLDAEYIYNNISSLVNFGTDDDDGATAANAVEQMREVTEIYSNTADVTTISSEALFLDPDYAARQLQEMGQQVAVAAAVGLTATIEYESVEQAQEVQDTILGFLDTIMASETVADTVYSAARAAKAAIVEDLESTILDLSSLVDYTLLQTSNTLELSNTIYGSVEEEAEIIGRNAIIDPFFVSPAKPLKVVISGS